MIVEFFGETLLLGRKREFRKKTFSLWYIPDPFTMKVDS